MIHLKDVTYTYPFQTRYAIEGLSLDVEPGQAVLCTGMSGCGKSTLVRLINGLVPHYHQGSMSGSVQVAGNDNLQRTIAEIAMDVGTLMQDPEHQFLTLNVTDELAFAHEWRGGATDGIANIVHTAADLFDLRNLLNADLLTLSEGEKQKVALAAVVSLKPRLLVLDEPSANLDPGATRELAQTLLRLKQAGMTLFIVDHRLYWLKDVVDTVMVMSHGRIVHTGSFESLDSAQFREQHGLRCTQVQNNIEQLPAAQDFDHDAITIHGLTFGYTPDALIFDNDTVQLPAGEVIAVTGRNGAGKTTLARLMTGLETMAGGAVRVHGESLAPNKILQLGSIVLQNTDHQLHMKTVCQELDICARTRATHGGADPVQAMLDMFSLGHLAQRHPQSLSGGEKQRLVIACAMVRSPQVLVLDEPTSGLDGRNMRLIANGVRQLASTGACVLVISHDLELIATTATARLALPLAKGLQSNKTPKREKGK
jgi:energy-coupling factor transport system ATP-binding protein